MALFKRAVKEAAKLRMAISGPSGSGKTYTALTFATELAAQGNGKIAVVDTESGSASKYADQFTFDVAELNNFNPKNYVNAIREAAQAGYDVVVLDSITHAWNGKGGILDIVGGNFSKWKDVAPLEREFIQTMISHDIHIIATMRAKAQYEVEKDERGKATPKKVGMGAIQRDGIEYEFDIVGMMDLQNTLTIEKTRCSALRGEVVPTPDARFMKPVIAWLGNGAEPAETPAQAPAATPTQTAPATNGNGHKAEPPAEDAPEVEMISKAQMVKLNALGTKLYGNNGTWTDKRHQLAAYFSGARTESSKELTAEEADRMITALQRKVNEAAAAVQTAPETQPEEPVEELP